MLTDLNKFNKVCEERKEFSYRAFGDAKSRSCIYPLRHLAKEVKELLVSPNDPMEWADCFLLLLDAAQRQGFTVDDLTNFAIQKLAINKKRDWTKQPDGTFRHVEDIEDEADEENPDLAQCEQCNEKAWDGRICHACGMKEI